jgi:hypothetical protein
VDKKLVSNLNKTIMGNLQWFYLSFW